MVNELLCMKLKRVTEPFDAGRVVELKFELQGPFVGEMYLRVPANQAVQWQIGDEYTVRMRSI